MIKPNPSTSENPEFPSVVIDEEGYPQFGDLRVADVEVGRELLRNLYRHEGGAFYTHLQSKQHLVEAFDEPFVVQELLPPSKEGPATDQWRARLPYGNEFSFSLQSLRLDEWDRFHGRANEGDVPFVFSRKAQAQFFETCDEIADESFDFAGQHYEVPSYWPDFVEAEQPEYWTEIYQREEEPGWNLHQPAPALADMLPRLKLPKSRVLVLGCGEGQDASLFANAGHVVTAVDFSEEALRRARALWSEGSTSEKATPATAKIRWEQADALEDQPQWHGAFDLIFEHTCYCAINPSLRQTLVKNWRRYLAPQGQILGVFFCMDRPQGPPFGGTEWELRQRLKKDFQFLFWGRWKNSIQTRQGKELFVFARKLEKN